jgi:hypothetical protein
MFTSSEISFPERVPRHDVSARPSVRHYPYTITLVYNNSNDVHCLYQ